MSEEIQIPAEVRRFQGALWGEDYAKDTALIDGASESGPPLSRLDWRYLITKWIHRPAIVELLMEVVDTVFAAPTVYNDLSRSPSWRRIFLSSMAAEQKYLMIEELRDPILYASFILAIRKTERVLRRVDPLEVLGLR